MISLETHSISPGKSPEQKLDLCMDWKKLRENQGLFKKNKVPVIFRTCSFLFLQNFSLSFKLIIFT